MSGPGPGRGPGAAAVERALAGLPSPMTLVTDEQLASIDTLDTATLRSLRAACETAEEGVSYARRLLQGRLDILRAELGRRQEEDGDAAAGGLLSHLTTILSSDQTPSNPMAARSTRLRVPPTAAAHEAALDAIVDEASLAEVDEHGTDHLEQLVERLAAHERELSGIRRQLFDRIDALRDELARRYKDGSANVSEFLADRPTPS